MSRMNKSGRQGRMNGLIAEIVVELDALEEEAKTTDMALKGILSKLAV